MDNNDKFDKTAFERILMQNISILEMLCQHHDPKIALKAFNIVNNISRKDVADVLSDDEWVRDLLRQGRDGTKEKS